MKKRIRSIISMLLVAAMIFTAFPSYADESPQAAEIATAEQAEAIAGAEAEPQTDPASEAPEPSAAEPASEASADPAPSAQPAASEPADQEVTEPAASAPVVEEGAGEDEVVEEDESEAEGSLTEADIPAENASHESEETDSEIIEETLTVTDGNYVLKDGAIVEQEIVEEEESTEIIGENEGLTSGSTFGFFSARRAVISLKSGNYVDWIDRVDIPSYGRILYDALVEGADNDENDDILIDEAYLEEGLTLYDESTNIVISDTEKYTIVGCNCNYEAKKKTDKYAKFVFLNEIRTSKDDFTAEDEVRKAAYSAFDAFDRDHPEVFWLLGDASIGMTEYQSKIASTGKIVSYRREYFLTLKSYTDKPFDIRHEEYRVGKSKIKSDITTRDTQVNGKKTLVGGMGDVPSEIEAINSWLTKNCGYNTTSSGEYPKASRECLSALNGEKGANGPICEGYARAFKVLCDKAEIPCVLCDGSARSTSSGTSEAHMWNYVYVYGNWYAVDVTWNDPVTGNGNDKTGDGNEDYLLVGSETVKNELKFSESHPVTNKASNGGIAFTNGPVLNETAYNVTRKQLYVKDTKGEYACGSLVSKDDVEVKIIEVKTNVSGTTTTEGEKIQDFEITSDTSTPGKGTITVEYTGTETDLSSKTVTIDTKVTMELHNENTTVTLTEDDFSYTGGQIVPEPTVVVTLPSTKTKVTLSDEIDYSLSWNNNVDGGTEGYGTITVTGRGNYTGTVTKTFRISRYTITYVLNGGENPSDATTTYSKLSNTFRLPVPTRTGYTFAGWYTSSSFSGDPVLAVTAGSTGDKTFYAKWNVNKYTVEFDGNGAESGSVASISDIEYGKTFTAPANGFVRSTPWTFSGWNTKEDGSGDDYTAGASISKLSAEDGATIKLFAQWKITKQSVTGSNIEWEITEKGELKVTGTGDLPAETTSMPWSSCTESIRKATVTVTNMTNMNNLFSGCSQLKTVNLSGFNAALVTSAENLFSGCTSLATIETPTNLTISISLPNSDGGSWTGTSGSVTELPKSSASTTLSFLYDPTGISFDEEVVSVALGKTVTLGYKIEPAGANPAVTFTSSDTSIAEVSETGVVTPKKLGTVTITAKTGNGKTATCTVEVTREACSISEIGKIIKQIEDIAGNPSADDKTVTIDMEKNTTVPAADLELILSAAKGADIDLLFTNIGSKAVPYTWTVNGKNITSVTSTAMNFEAYITDTINTEINTLAAAVQEKKDGWTAMQLHLSHSGELGFTGVLSFYVGATYAAKDWVLYYFDETKTPKVLTKTTNSGKVSASGYIDASFVHASEYLLLIDNRVTPEPEKEEEEAEEEEGETKTKTNSTTTSAANTTTLTSPVTGDER